ncbi:MAG: D-hexose-6-phosphate mutarotase [Steroidobacteraceae bacterium]
MTDKSQLQVAGASVEVHDYGAHVTSWRTADGVERLFLSQRAEFGAGKAIRGGVPIIFPQFAGLGPLPKHGFARTKSWQRVSSNADSVLFTLQDDAATRANWPHAFTAEYLIQLGDNRLQMTLCIRNTGVQAFTFTAALHTYLRVTDIDRVSVTGLVGLRYSDSAAGGAMALENSSAVRIAGEVDRIYFDALEPIVVHESGRTLECSARGFTDAVIWNPGAVKAAALADLEPEGYRHMLCVEAAIIGTPVSLLPGESWSGAQQLTLA